MDADGSPYNLFFYTSPYKRSRQTYDEILKAIEPKHMMGAQEEVQLREQDFGNFQVPQPLPRASLGRLPIDVILFIIAGPVDPKTLILRNIISPDGKW